jgi:hypothetical protein
VEDTREGRSRAREAADGHPARRPVHSGARAPS